TRSRPISDWVMVCSSTLRAKPVTHSTKRCWPRWVKPTAIGNRMACQSDHSGVTFIAHLLEGWFVGGHNRQAPSRRCACQSTRMQDNGERHCQTLDFTRNYCLVALLPFSPASRRHRSCCSPDLHTSAETETLWRDSPPVKKPKCALASPVQMIPVSFGSLHPSPEIHVAFQSAIVGRDADPQAKNVF